MSKGNTFENDWLKLIFQAIPILGLAADAASGAYTALTIALHTSDPGEGGTQATNEIVYTGYLRQSVPRSTSGWTVTGNSASPVAPIDFPAMTGGAGGNAQFFSVGTGVADKLLYSGPVSPLIPVVIGVIPRLPTSTQVTED
jgi:hypothetical protein